MKDTELAQAVMKLFVWARHEYKRYSNVAPQAKDSYYQGKIIGSMAAYYAMGKEMRTLFAWLTEALESKERQKHGLRKSVR